MRLFRLFFSTTLCCVAWCTFAVEMDLPTETAVYRSSNMPGYQLVQKNCIACHSAQYVTTQPPSTSRNAWHAIVTKMQKNYGAPIAEDDIPAMVDYLVTVYGRQRSADRGQNTVAPNRLLGAYY